MAKDEVLLLENQLCFPLYVASRLTTRVYTPLLEELGLTYPQYLVLLVLWENDNLSVGELSKKLYLDYNTLTPLLKRLEDKNLVIRKRSPSDERSVKIQLTELGSDLRQKAFCIPENLIVSLNNSVLNLEEIQQFKLTLNKLINALEK
ncbi:MAG: MarR family transcriptional regulator [Bacteroidia bacterium]|nr:MarR family transcriptional regulator [Bacteroidia bacterium]